ncbi:SDR family oxidoreductase [Rhodococcus sp. 05-2256-B2]|uniref:SDR family NAD(P)-dependent oxidoreductase n=1 Tax=Nocardiaceae TaxID=85025 RepID=UPI00050CD1A5|nr:MULTISPECIES: SDR family NAD(P)-dependent oxidoreductase [Rhodococcus]OZD87643.1 SDR family oxidoreductase [Rhodococcus sp. 05-2256-B4]OZD89908.1 SDR family oxidoreductase [Rhodococcus sp. 05-2256-B2]OZD92226.1 SDR family oxidoreductase [Rhodococcus sp. 05-2256-B3]OZD98931.1 SDR family oxidoreductase [Rhodococcus sp. 05-2256-B1]
MTTGGLAGRTALITGAAGDIGHATTVALAAAGADVVCVGRRQEPLEKVAAHVREIGGRALVVVADVTDEDAVKAAVAATHDEFGHLDIVVNNAGGARFLAPITDMEQRGWDRTIALNLTAPYLVGRAASSGMIARGSGVIVNIGSLAGLQAQDSMAHYSAAKGGLQMLTRSMSKEWGSHGIRVNTVVPGLIRTEGWSHYEGTGAMDALLDQDIPLGRWGRAEEIAMPVVFLCSDDASFITGSTLVVDGGALA